VASAGLTRFAEGAAPWVHLRRALGPLAVFTAALLLVLLPVPSPCPVRLVLRIPCPSCGLTRAARLALAGDWAGATHMHPLWFVVLPFVSVVAAVECAAYVRTGSWGVLMSRRWVQRAGIAVAASLVVVWVARWFGAFGGPVGI
jgi:hypothetical protein